MSMYGSRALSSHWHGKQHQRNLEREERAAFFESKYLPEYRAQIVEEKRFEAEEEKRQLSFLLNKMTAAFPFPSTWQHHLSSLLLRVSLDESNASSRLDAALSSYVLRERCALLELALIKFALLRRGQFTSMDEVREYSILEPSFVFESHLFECRCSEVHRVLVLIVPFMKTPTSYSNSIYMKMGSSRWLWR